MLRLIDCEILSLKLKFGLSVLSGTDILVEADVLADWLALVEADSDALVDADWLALVLADSDALVDADSEADVIAD